MFRNVEKQCSIKKHSSSSQLFVYQTSYNWGVLLYGLFIRIATARAIFAMDFWEIVALTTSGNRIRHIVSSQNDTVAGLLGCWSQPIENKEF